MYRQVILHCRLLWRIPVLSGTAGAPIITSRSAGKHHIVALCWTGGAVVLLFDSPILGKFSTTH